MDSVATPQPCRCPPRRDDGLLGGALDGLGAGGGGVVGRDIEHVVCVARRAGDGDNIVRVGEGVCIHGAAGLLKRGLDDLDW